MKRRFFLVPITLKLALVAGMAGGGTVAQATGGYLDLPSDGPKVMKRCNPRNIESRQRCRVQSLPGLPGYTQVASRSSPIVINEITIGTLDDRVWKDSAGNHIFGMRVRLTAEPYDPSGAAFNMNDLFRRLLPAQAAAIAYFPGSPQATKALKKAGRTVIGLNEVPLEEEEPGTEEEAYAADFTALHGMQPPRDNSWVDFRIDANAAEPSGTSSPFSPWLLLKTRAPAGFAVKPFAVRALSSDVAEQTDQVAVLLSGYQPN